MLRLSLMALSIALSGCPSPEAGPLDLAPLDGGGETDLRADSPGLDVPSPLDQSPPHDLGPEASQDSSTPDAPQQGFALAEFALLDLNPNSPWFGLLVGPSDLLGKVYLLYFADAG